MSLATGFNVIVCVGCCWGCSTVWLEWVWCCCCCCCGCCRCVVLLFGAGCVANITQMLFCFEKGAHTKAKRKRKRQKHGAQRKCVNGILRDQMYSINSKRDSECVHVWRRIFRVKIKCQFDSIRTISGWFKSDLHMWGVRKRHAQKRCIQLNGMRIETTKCGRVTHAHNPTASFCSCVRFEATIDKLLLEWLWFPCCHLLFQLLWRLFRCHRHLAQSWFGHLYRSLLTVWMAPPMLMTIHWMPPLWCCFTWLMFHCSCHCCF